MGFFKRTRNLDGSDLAQVLKELLVQVGEVKRLSGELEYTLANLREDATQARLAAVAAEESALKALEQEDEQGAREQLVRRNRELARVASSESQAAIYEGKLADLKTALVALREQVEDFQQERELVESRLNSAGARLAIERAKQAMQSAGSEALESVKTKARQQEALIELREDLDAQLAQLEADAQKEPPGSSR